MRFRGSSGDGRRSRCVGQASHSLSRQAIRHVVTACCVCRGSAHGVPNLNRSSQGRLDPLQTTDTSLDWSELIDQLRRLGGSIIGVSVGDPRLDATLARVHGRLSLDETELDNELLTLRVGDRAEFVLEHELFVEAVLCTDTLLINQPSTWLLLVFRPPRAQP
jgi:hypothetical protein